jgi:hypothetical protein
LKVEEIGKGKNNAEAQGAPRFAEEEKRNPRAQSLRLSG